jgi:hypothetical protein
MKNKNIYLLLAMAIVAFFFINSCKKTDQSNIPNLLTAGVWQLASVQQTYYIGDSRIKTDTLNAKCDTTQTFIFNKDNTCTYTNFECLIQPTATGKWLLTSDKLFLSSDIVCRDTTKKGSSTPFSNVRFVNLGQYSMVIETGDIGLYYSSTQRRTIRRYGFIRQRTASN